MQTVLPVAQDIVRAAADDDALALFRQLLDDLALRDIELIVHGEVVVAVALGRGQIEQQAVAGVGIFAVLLDVLRRKAAALCDLIDQLAVIERIAELLCDLLADAAAPLPNSRLIVMIFFMTVSPRSFTYSLPNKFPLSWQVFDSLIEIV